MESASTRNGSRKTYGLRPKKPALFRAFSCAEDGFFHGFLIYLVSTEREQGKSGFVEEGFPVKKKIAYVTAIFAMILVCLILYFIPMPLLDCLDEEGQISIQVSEFSVSYGKPSIEPVTYSEITQEQKERIFALCSQYSYRRSLSTLFSDGSMSGLGNKVAYIFINGVHENNNYIVISSSGEIAIENKTFKMKHAERFIDQMTEILGSR